MARFIAKGYNQREGIYYTETFAPVIKIQSLRLLFAIAINEGLKIHHIDVSEAFLYGEIEEDKFIDPPDGYNIKLKENEVLK